MPDFPLGTSFSAAYFASASRFCHLFLHKPSKNSAVKNFQTSSVYDMISRSESKQKFVDPGEKSDARRPGFADEIFMAGDSGSRRPKLGLKK
jgi:hypothetical protein